MWSKIAHFSTTSLLILPATKNIHFLFVSINLSALGNPLSALGLETLHPSVLPRREVSSLHTLSPLPSAVNHGPSMATQAQGEQEVIKILRESCSQLSVLSLLRLSVFHLKIPNFLLKKQVETEETGGKFPKPQIYCCFLVPNSRTCLARDWCSELSPWGCFTTPAQIMGPISNTILLHVPESRSSSPSHRAPQEQLHIDLHLCTT